MNNGVLTSGYAPPPMPYGLLGIPQPTPMPGDPWAYVDEDAVSYIRRVEAADRLPLEAAVKRAIYDFVVGCKQDGTWSAIKASCILMGARTLAGALVPLVGVAPTNFNFVSGDYNRRTGLIGGSGKYISSNRPGIAESLNNKHVAVFVSAANTSNTFAYYFATGFPSDFLAYHGFTGAGLSSGANSLSINSQNTLTATAVNGFLLGLSRSSSASYAIRAGGSSVAANVASNASNRTATNQVFFGQGAIQNTTARMPFYSIGEAVDLVALDTRVSALYTAIGAAIP